MQVGSSTTDSLALEEVRPAQRQLSISQPHLIRIRQGIKLKPVIDFSLKFLDVSILDRLVRIGM